MKKKVLEEIVKNNFSSVPTEFKNAMQCINMMYKMYSGSTEFSYTIQGYLKRYTTKSDEAVAVFLHLLDVSGLSLSSDVFEDYAVLLERYIKICEDVDEKQDKPASLAELSTIVNYENENYPDEVAEVSIDIQILSKLYVQGVSDTIRNKAIAEIFERYKFESLLKMIIFVRTFTREGLIFSYEAYPEFKELICNVGKMIRSSQTKCGIIS